MSWNLFIVKMFIYISSICRFNTHFIQSCVFPHFTLFFFLLLLNIFFYILTPSLTPFCNSSFSHLFFNVITDFYLLARNKVEFFILKNIIYIFFYVFIFLFLTFYISFNLHFIFLFLMYVFRPFLYCIAVNPFL